MLLPTTVTSQKRSARKGGDMYMQRASARLVRSAGNNSIPSISCAAMEGGGGDGGRTVEGIGISDSITANSGRLYCPKLQHMLGVEIKADA